MTRIYGNQMRLSARGVIGSVFIVGMAALFVRLGFWQLDRLEQRRARNAALEGALTLPPIVLDSAAVRAVDADPARFVNRRVVVRGAYLPDDLLLRGRAFAGRPGVHVVTPLAIDGVPRTVLVNRGWVPSPDGATADTKPFAEPGARSIEGIFQAVPVTENGGQPSPSQTGALTYRRLDLETLRGRVRPPILPLYVQQLPGPDSLSAPPPRRVSLPPLSEGSHLSYAVQWFSFAAIALVGLGILLARGQRRSAKHPSNP